MSKLLGAERIRLNLVDLVQTATDPSAAGVASAIGSFLLRSGTGQAWLKTGAGDTDWDKLVQSFAWYSVKDYKAIGNGITDDTAAVVAAIADCNAAGGGVVYFPFGTYAVTQISLAGVSNVQFLGAGAGSVIKWVWNAATAAGSMITLSGGTTRTRFSMLRFDGSGLTNPDAGRGNHLLQIGTGASAVTLTQIFNCTFGGMVASSGDGVHVLGAAGNLVSRLWISENVFDGCSRFSIGAEQGWEYGWILQNYLTNCETEIAVVATADVNTNALIVHGNICVHTAAGVTQALRLEGGATTFITRLVVANNTIQNGLATLSRAQYATVTGNIETSGDFAASTDAVFRIFGNVQQVTCTNNIFARTSGAGIGPCITVEKSTSSPTAIRLGNNLLLNDRAGAGFIKIVDVTKIAVGGNLCRSADAATLAFGIDIQAVTVNLSDVLIGPGNQVTAVANSFAGGVHLLCNGTNVVDCSVVGNQGDTMDYGLVLEVGGGGGAFTGQLLYGGNNFDSTLGDINKIGTTVAVRVGFNAGVFGSNLWQGSGSPEAVVTSRISSMYLRSDGGQATSVYYKETGTGNTGWIGIGGSEIVFGTGDSTTVATAVFAAPGWIAIATATEVQFAVTRAGTIRNFYVNVATAGTGAATNTFTVRKNAVDTAVTTTLGNTATGVASDLTHSFAVAIGDLLSISIVKTGVVAAGQQNITFSMELV